MTASSDALASGLVPGADEPVWHTLSTEQVLQTEDVDGQCGLSLVEALSHAQQFGPNSFDAGKVESRWRAFVRQYADPMQVVLLVAGIGSLYPLKEWETGIVLIFLTLFNAVLGLRQEEKAATAVWAPNVGEFWVDRLVTKFWVFHTIGPSTAAAAWLRDRVESRRDTDWMRLPCITPSGVMQGSLIARHAGSVRGRFRAGRRHVKIRAGYRDAAAGQHRGGQQQVGGAAGGLGL